MNVLNIKAVCRLFLIILFLSSSLVGYSQFFGDYQRAASCNLTLNLTDSQGDGWGNGYVYIKVNGVPQNIYSTTSGFSSYQIAIPDNANVELTYEGGTNNAENAYQLLNASGDVLYEDGLAYTGTIAVINRYRSFTVGCPLTCSGQNGYTVNLKLGQTPVEIGWEIWDVGGSKIAFAAPSSYSGFSKGMEVNVPINLENCAGYYFKILGSETAWSDGHIKLYADNGNRGTYMTEGDFEGKGLVYEQTDFSMAIRDTIAFPCVTCPEDVLVTDADATTCSKAGFIYPATKLPKATVCYPDYNGQAGAEPQVLISYPHLQIGDHTPDTPVDLPIGENMAILKTVYADGQILRCTTKVTVASNNNPPLNCHASLSTVLGDENQNCGVELLPSDVIPGDFCNNEYRISLQDENGNPMSGTFIGSDKVGKTLYYTVTAIVTGGTCTGSIRVEDAIAPKLQVNNYTIPCNHPDPLNENYTNRDTLSTLQTLPMRLVGYGATNIEFDAACMPFGEVIQSVQVRLLIEHRKANELGNFTLTSPSGVNFPMVKEVVSNTELVLSVEHDLTVSTGLDKILNQPADTAEGVWRLLIFDNLDILNRGTLKQAALILETGFPNFNQIADCDGALTQVISERLETRLCDENGGGAIYRVWEAKDPSGNKTLDEQVVYLAKPSFSDLEMPESVSISCGADFSPQSVGSPSYQCAPISESNLSVCRMTYTYTDTEIPSCGSSKIINRQWRVVNWCADASVTHNQSIHLVDDTAPSVEARNLTVGTNIYTCNGTAQITSYVEDVCSGLEKVTATYFYKEENQEGYNRTVDITNNQSIEGLQLGLNTVRILATDSCGNIGRDTVFITVEDVVPPTPLCDGLTISLGPNGSGRVNASDLDAGSYDNCGVSKIELKRVDPGCLPADNFASFIELECCDVGKIIEVEMRVTDVHGNQNSCFVEVKVEDKYLPFIACPADTTIVCEAFTGMSNLAAYGLPRVEDNCSATYDEDVQDNRNACGEGTIVRTFTATDSYGNKISCRQTITLVSDKKIIIQFPADTTILGCNSDLENLNEPKLLTEGCVQVGVSYTDEPFDLVSSENCKAYRRKWRVYNWCGYDESVVRENNTGIALGNRTFEDDGDGYFEFYQVISISNTVRPTYLEKDLKRRISIACDSAHEFPMVKALSYCGDTLNAVPTTQQMQVSIGDSIPVVYTVTDACGNTARQTYTYIFEDKMDPTPVCFTNLNFAMSENGTVEIYARDLANRNLTQDGCGDKNKLRYSFSTNVTDTVRRFTCKDVGQRRLEIFVTDPSGNYGSCFSNIEIKPGKTCGPFTLSGKVQTAAGMEVIGAKVSIGPELEQVDTTNENGYYGFSNLNTNQDYILEAQVKSPAIEGVTIFDLLLLQQHLLGKELLQEKHQFLAADVDQSSFLSVTDLMHIQQVLLGKAETFPQQASWRTVSSESMQNEMDWSQVKNTIDVLNFQETSLNHNFTALKMGDINQSMGVQTVTSRSIKKLWYEIEEGEAKEMVVYAAESFEPAALQIKLDLSTEYLEIKGKEINISMDEYHYSNDHLNIVKVFDELQTIEKGTELFRITLDKYATLPLDVEESIYINSSKETYEIRFERKGSIQEPVLVYPNPFREHLTLENIPDGAKAIEIYNMKGQKVWAQENEKIENSRLEINVPDLEAGFYYLIIKTIDKTETFKLVKS